jgi:acyl dehydratase
MTSSSAPADSVLADRSFPLITDDALNELRSRIGVEFPVPEPYLTEATPDAIRHFADGIGDQNPLWRDGGYARETSWGAVLSPPTILYAFDRVLSGYVTGLPGIHAMFAGTDFKWSRPIRAGDRLVGHPVLSEVRLLESKFSARSVLQRYSIRFTDEAGEEPCVADSWVIRTQRDVARQRTQSSDEQAAPTQWSKDEIATIFAAYAAEQPRGAEPRYWEDTDVGDELDERLKGPATVTSFIAWDLGWGGLYIKAHKPAYAQFADHPGLAIPNILGIPEPPERVHWDDSMAVAVGVPAAYDYGPERISWLAHLLTDWMGDDGMLARLNVQVRRHNMIGDLTKCRGTVTRKWREKDSGLVEIDVYGINQRDQKTVQGTAVVRLPMRSDGRS